MVIMQQDPKPNSKKKPKIVIRSVWAHNVEPELLLIGSLIQRYPFAAMDTEFPGVVYHSNKHPMSLSVRERYDLLRRNVDDLHLIQIGLTISDAAGHLPDLGSEGAYGFIWEFNFNDFDIHQDLYAPNSIELLKSRGIDFELNRRDGIDSRLFAWLLITSGIIGGRTSINWVTFHSAYDFGYLIKILTRKKLPETLEVFLKLISVYFGETWYDMKHVMRYCHNLYGGLDRVASTLKVERAVGQAHQAGSDSLLTWQSFLKMKTMFFPEVAEAPHAGVLYGLEVHA